MAKKKSDNVEQHIADKFADMLIEKIESLKVDWTKLWVTTTGNMTPVNMDGRGYNGTNAFMLMLLQEKQGWQVPYYMTYNKAKEMGVDVKKGEKGFPVCYWNLNITGPDGKKVSLDDYKEMSQEEQDKCRKYPFLKYYVVFNVQQTRFPELKPEEYAAMVEKCKPSTELKDEDGMFKNMELDYMLKNQSWVCPVKVQRSDNAYYSPPADHIVVPLKGQFISGEEFYGTLLHEMAHSTGHKDRLARDMKGGFGSEDYAKEELVAEMTSAVTCQQAGITKGIQSQNVAYLQSWLNILHEKPKFILSIMGDVNKAVTLINDHVFNPKVAEAIKNESIQSIGSFLDSKKTEEQQNVQKSPVMTAEEMAAKTGSIHKSGTPRFGTEIPVQVQQPAQEVRQDAPEIDPLVIQAYNLGKEKNPDKVLVVMDFTNKLMYSVGEDAAKIAELTDAVLHQGDVPYIEMPEDSYTDLIPKVFAAGHTMAVTNTSEVSKSNAMQSQQVEPDGKKLFTAHLGNGIVAWEAGDDSYTVHIGQDRRITVEEDKYFEPQNADKIRELAHQGNMIVGNSKDTRYLVLDPLEPATRLSYNEMTHEVYYLSVESVKDKQYAVSTDGSRFIFNERPEQLARINYPKDMTFNVQGLENVRPALQQVEKLGFNISEMKGSSFRNVLEDLENTLDAVERQSYRLVFQPKDHNVIQFAKNVNNLDPNLPNFYFKNNHLKFNTPGQGQTMNPEKAILTGIRIVRLQGLDSMEDNIRRLEQLGVSFKTDSFYANTRMGIKGMQEMTGITPEEKKEATLFFMVKDGVVVDSEPTVDLTQYRDYAVYNMTDKGLKPYNDNLSTNLKNKSMEQNVNNAPQEQAEAKRQHADGVDVYKTKSNVWVVQQWKDGQGSRHAPSARMIWMPTSRPSRDRQKKW